MNGAGHSVGMNRLALIFSVVMGSGCLVPVDIDVPDGSVVLPDGSVLLPDAGACIPPATIDISPGTPIVLPPECANATATVRGPDGGIVGAPGETVTPSSPGVFIIDTEHDGRVDHTFVYVDGPLTGGVTTKYVDRVDVARISEVYLTQNKRLLALGYDNTLTVYETDGGRLQELDFDYFASASTKGLAVAGQSIWAARDGGIEHFSETENGLELDGRINHIIVSDSAARFADVTEGAVVVAGWTGVYKFQWTGSAIEIENAFPLVQLPAAGVFVEGDHVWDYMFCAVQAGCESQLCTSVRTCPSEVQLTGGREGDDKLWIFDNAGSFPESSLSVLESMSIRLMNRALPSPLPFSPARHAPLGPNVAGWLLSNGGPAYLSLSNDHYLVPVPQNGSFYFGAVDFVRGVNQRYIIVQEDPFTLRFIPR